MKKVVHAICIFLSLAFAFVAVTFCWFSRGELLNFRDDFGSAKASYFGGGDGSSEENAYVISSSTHFYNLAWLQYLGYFNAAGGANNGRLQSYFKLTKNIDMSELQRNGTVSALPPIGTEQYPFIGNFNGNGHKIDKVFVSNLMSDLIVRPTTYKTATDDNNNEVLAVYGTTGTTTKAVNIVGLFGVTGDYGVSADAKGVVSGSNEYTNKFKDSLSLPTAATTSGADEVYYGVMKVENLYTDNLSVKSASSKTLVGLAAGYASASLSNVGVYRCDITVNAGATGLSDSAPLSNYSLLGDYNDAVITWDEKPSGGGGGGSGNDWGGSINIYELSKRITYIMNDSMSYSAYTSVAAPNKFGLNNISYNKYNLPDTSFYESTGIQAYLYNGSYFPLGVNTDTEFSGGEITGKKTDSGSKYSNWKTATTSFFSDLSNSSEILKNNTGYVTSPATTNQHDGTLHYIRDVSTVQNSFGGTTYDADKLVMLTYQNGTFVRIKDGDNITRNTALESAFSDTVEASTLKRYKAVKEDLSTIFTNSGNLIYTLGWTNTDSSILPGNFTMDGTTYTSLLAPGIDFVVHKKGCITIVFCSVSNDTGNKLVSLYKVDRTDGTPKKGVEITDGIPSSASKEFATNKCILYLEIEVEAGEYFITTDTGTISTAADFMYLDIGANAGGESGGGSTPGTAAYTIDTVDFVNNTTDYAANGKFTAFKDVTFNLSGAGTSGVPSVSFERAAAADGEDTAATKVAYIYSNITVSVTPKDGSLSSGPEKKENAA